MAADHTRGEMDISHHKGTFNGFMSVSLWSALITGLSVFYLTLVFATGTDWLGALIGVAVLGALLGLVLKMKTAWYITVAGLLVFGLIAGGMVQLFGAVVAG